MRSENLRYAVSTIRNQTAVNSRSGGATGLRLK